MLSGVDTGGLASAVSPAAGGAHFDIPTLQSFADGLKDKLAANIGTMTGATVTADNAVVEGLSRDQLLAKVPEVAVAVMADFSSGLNGDHLFIMSSEFAQKVASLVNNEENAELDDMALSVISEMVSSHSGAEITELSKDGSLPGLATIPAEAVSQPKAMIRMPQGSFVLFTYPLTVDGNPYTLWEAVSGPVADGIAKALGGGAAPASPAPNFAQSSPAASFAQPAMMGGMQQPMGGMNMGMQQSSMGGMPVMNGMGMAQPVMGGTP
ncbi:MAG: flagellar motor switch protein FliN, partial [Treponema sp.]|nr:flagellar motor switch protein FliN [Treponema sp.]